MSAGRGKTGLIYSPERQQRYRAMQQRQAESWARKNGPLTTRKLTPEEIQAHNIRLWHQIQAKKYYQPQ